MPLTENITKTMFTTLMNGIRCHLLMSLSYNRLEKIYWIKATLLDEKAILKKGWDNQGKAYFKDRRVAIVKGNYVVIIRFTGLLKAKFVTAFEKEDIGNILSGPDFERSGEYFGEAK